MDFTALDFETATFQRDSACAVGVAVVRGGEVKEAYSTLIRPPSMRFEKKCSEIHGIRAADVSGAPTFAEVWPQVSKFIGNGPVAMHNAAFDIGVLVASLDACKMPVPDLRYFCTLELARVALPGLPNHRLPTLATVFGIPLDHHDAASDAVACARLATLLTRLLDPRGMELYLQDICDYAARRIVEQVSGGASVRIRLDYTDGELCGQDGFDGMTANGVASDERFAGLRFVFTGNLSFLTRAEATHIVEAHGGKASGSVSSKTNFVVVGENALAAWDRGGKATGKLAAALEMRDAGAKITIIREPDFLRLCENGPRGNSAEAIESMVLDEDANVSHVHDL